MWRPPGPSNLRRPSNEQNILFTITGGWTGINTLNTNTKWWHRKKMHKYRKITKQSACSDAVTEVLVADDSLSLIGHRLQWVRCSLSTQAVLCVIGVNYWANNAAASRAMRHSRLVGRLSSLVGWPLSTVSSTVTADCRVWLVMRDQATIVSHSHASLSLSLSLSHTHTHTHCLSLSVGISSLSDNNPPVATDRARVSLQRSNSITSICCEEIIILQKV